MIWIYKLTYVYAKRIHIKDWLKIFTYLRF